MKLSQKDKSLILFLVATLIVIWALISLLLNIFHNANYHKSDVNKIFVSKDAYWFNTSRSVNKEDLKGKLVLLDFWSYSCVYCIQSLPQIRELQDDLGSKITVIGVHSARFEGEKNRTAIKKAILKYNIDFPVIDDSNLKIWKKFNLKYWPTYILINPYGNIIEKFSTKKDLKKLTKAVKKAAKKYKYEINRDPLPTLPEKYNTIGNVLSFPTDLKSTKNFSFRSKEVPAIFIANSSKNKIYVTSLSGDILFKIGSGVDGFEDGGFASSSFSRPRGLLYKSGKLYVADTGNNALRVIDFKKKEVATLIGSGELGGIIKYGKKIDADDFDLSSPNALEFFPDSNHIVIANSGANQILSYDIKKHLIKVVAGDGSLGDKDGKLSTNSLAQTADLAVYNKKLYFVDSKSSSLRVLDKSGNVQTLIGQGLSKFGNKTGSKDEALMQNPSGLEVDDTGVYIVDSFNNSIKKYNFSSKKLSNYFGSGKIGEVLGDSKESEFDEPKKITSVLNRFYISDTNNNRIVSISRSKPKSEVFNVMPPQKLPREGFLEYLPNLEVIKTIKVKSNTELKLKITLEKGWKINKKGPSFINLLELVDDDQANLVTSFDWNSVKAKKMKISRLESGEEYILQGTIYFCEDKEKALCYIKSYEQKIEPDSDSENKEITIKLSR